MYIYVINKLTNSFLLQYSPSNVLLQRMFIDILTTESDDRVISLKDSVSFCGIFGALAKELDVDSEQVRKGKVINSGTVVFSEFHLCPIQNLQE